ncbi:Crp/Fnr family transcriptional regulator [Methyloligella sp. 2.7D]|uniref:Crp/Fnr family transcriptional regulator n=1 Tax=unclassified Methyloligella TaxID=2625955 RepID=UPI001ABBBC59|nr:Crp/Fnr family transcriptional regulator [Methyloligella sp. GL2]
MYSTRPALSLPEFLLKSTPGVSRVRFKSRDVIFHQGEAAHSVYYLIEGRVQLSVVSEQGKEAIIAILEPDEIFGESCLLGYTNRRMTACVLDTCRVLRVSNDAALRLMADDVGFDRFLIRKLIKSGLRTQEQLLDQLFNSSEKRLARLLLMLTNCAKDSARERTIPKLSQEALAEMVGSTRPRVNQFMNKFRKLGYIDYDGVSITVHRSLSSVLIYDSSKGGDEDSFNISA